MKLKANNSVMKVRKVKAIFDFEMQCLAPLLCRYILHNFK